jgi:hypothetical protein
MASAFFDPENAALVKRLKKGMATPFFRDR